jgi:hypothetical protein
MKNILISLILLFVFTIMLSAQDSIQKEDSQVLVNKKGKVILPQKGDWAVGIDAASFINFIGGIFSNGSESPSLAFKDGMAFYGKYFLKDKLALRMGIGGNYRCSDYAIKDTSVIQSFTMYESHTSSYNVFLSGGIEKRFGKKRLQYYIGGNLEMELYHVKENRKYIIPINYAPRTYYRKNDYGLNMRLGLNVFAGVEYFVLPKLSIGGELGWGISYNHPFKGHEHVEFWDIHYDEYSNIVPILRIIDRDHYQLKTFNMNNFSGSILLLYHF